MSDPTVPPIVNRISNFIYIMYFFNYFIDYLFIWNSFHIPHLLCLTSALYYMFCQLHKISFVSKLQGDSVFPHAFHPSDPAHDHPKQGKRWLPYLTFCMAPFSCHISTVEWRTVFPIMPLLSYDTLAPKMHCNKDKFYIFLCSIFAIISWDLQLLFWFLNSPDSSFKNQISCAPDVLLLFLLYLTQPPLGKNLVLCLYLFTLFYCSS